MPSIRGVIRQSILTEAIPRKTSARRAELESLSNPLKRTVALGLHSLAVRYPESLSPYVGLGPRETEVHPVGVGADSQVFRVGDMVAKVHKKSIGASLDRQKQILARKRLLFSMLHEYLPDFTLLQDTDIAPHPLYPKYSAVITTQPYRHDIVDTKLFRRDHGINNGSLSRLSASEVITQQLTRLVTTSQELISERGLVPDFCGRSNLVLTDSGEQLLIIDGQPLKATAESGQRACARLISLQTVLLETAPQ